MSDPNGPIRFPSEGSKETVVPNARLEPGMKLGVHFTLVRSLGVGGMGEVWLASDSRRAFGDSGGLVALKFLPSVLSNSPRELRRVQETFAKVNWLKHEHICMTCELTDLADRGWVLVMEYFDGIGLLDYRDQYVAKHDTFPVSEVVRLLYPVASALDYAHNRTNPNTREKLGIVHRDIKPENILVSQDGEHVQVIDFGLAEQIRTSMTRVSRIQFDSAGTYPYMAPEQWESKKQDGRTDQYALGVVVYELLTDELPFRGSDVAVIMHQVLKMPLPEHDDIPQAVYDVLSRAMSKNMSERFSSCVTFLDALQQASVSPTPTERPQIQPQAPAIQAKNVENASAIQIQPRIKPSPLIAPFDSKAASEGQESWAKYLGKSVEWTNSIGMKFRLIPPGEFTMGAPGSEQGAFVDEKPQHRVRISEPFYLGIYPVTQFEYEKLMGSNPNDFVFLGTDNLPVESVSWDDCQAYLKRLGEIDQSTTYRLPTEAEWEYACRGGTTTPYWFGMELNGQQANCNGNHPYGTKAKGPYFEKTVPVGSYASNPFGLSDQHGQVSEWCQDWYAKDYYQQFAKNQAIDPIGPASGSSRVLRGGSWGSDAVSCRSAFRGDYVPTDRYFHGIGFRVLSSYL